jgi:hypothetical protein
LETALGIFDQYVFKSTAESVVRGLFNELEAERRGESIDWIEIREIIKVYLLIT